MTNKELPLAVVIVDVEDPQWQSTNLAASVALKESGYRTHFLNVSQLNFPRFVSSSRAKKKLDPYAVLDPDVEKPLEEEIALGVRSASLSIRKQDGGALFRILMYRVRQSTRAMLSTILSQKEYQLADCVVIPNGRFSYQPALEKHSRQLLGKKVMFLENSPEPQRIFLSDIRPHDRLGIQNRIEAMGSLVEEEIFLGEQLLQDRMNPRGRSNKFSSKFRRGKGDVSSRIEPETNSFFSSSLDEFWALGKNWSQHGWANQYSAFKAVIRTLYNNGERSFVMRLHPNLINKGLTQVLSEVISLIKLVWEIPAVRVVSYTSRLNSYELVLQSKRVFAHNSSIGLESQCLERPVWLSANSFYDEFLDCPRVISDISITPNSLEPYTVKSARAFGFLARKYNFGLQKTEVLIRRKSGIVPRIGMLVRTQSLYKIILFTRSIERAISYLIGRSLPTAIFLTKFLRATTRGRRAPTN